MKRRSFLHVLPYGFASLGLAQQEQKRDIRIKQVGPATVAPPTGSRDVRISSAGRKALCVGVDRYTSVKPLQNAVNDANDMDGALKKYRFQSSAAVDLSTSGLDQAVQRFAASIQPGDAAFFFFAGHGVQIGGTNFLIPADFKITSEADVAPKAYPAERALQAMVRARAGLAVVILDACRNNPFRPSQGGAGLAPVPPMLGTMTVFSTGAGQTASDNPGGRNGLFTGHFLAAMPTPQMALHHLTRKVRDAVFLASGQRQRPYIQEDVIGDFFLQDVGGGGGQQQTPSPAPAPNTPATGTDASIQQGIQAYRAGDYAKALAAFEGAARVNPENAAAWNAIGATLAQMGQLSRAVGMYAKAISIAPAYVAAYVNRGLAYLSVPRYEIAAQDFTWAIDEDSANPQLYLWRGQANLGLRQYEPALDDLNKAIELDAGSPESFRFRGRVLHKTAKFGEALQDYAIAIQLRPAYWQAFEDRAATYTSMGRHAEAKSDLAAAARLRGQ
jgi:uncharacterized caspase-like protein